MNKKFFIDLFLIILGNFILALSVVGFILPYNILSGGVAGIAVAIAPIVHVDKGLIVNGLVIVLFFIGWMVLGKKFAATTFLSSLIYPLFLSLLEVFMPPFTIDVFLASLYGGAIAGIGIGMVLKTGASTGGMDIPPLIINKITGVKISTLVMIIDALTVLLGLFTFGIEAVLIGFISVASCTYTIDKVLVFGGTVSKSVQIISEKYEVLLKLIHEKIDRGTTISNIIGGYTGKDRKMILVVVSQNQYSELIDVINSVDKEAFIITTDATSVHGKGFSIISKVWYT